MKLEQKKSNYKHFTLDVINGITLTLVVPSRWNKDKYPKYYIQYGKEKYYSLVKDTYLQYLDLAKHLPSEYKQQQLTDAFGYQIKEISVKIQSNGDEERLTLNTNVAAAVNQYFESQKKQSEIGELVDITDYRDRNKKLNDYFNLEHNQFLTLKDLNKDIWTSFRYFILENYSIKANSTVNQYIVYVKSFYNWLIIDKEIAIINHPLQLKKLDTSRQVPKYNEIPKDLLNDYLETLSKDEKYLRLYILSLLVLENAKRPVQLYRLQAKDIDLKNKTLFLQPKGRNRAKEVTIITNELAAAIQKVYDNTHAKGLSIAPDDFLLGGFNMFKKGGKPVSQGDIRDTQIVKFRKQYPKFKDIQVYSLKHTTITLVSKTDIKRAQRMASHRKQSTTEVYDRSKQLSEAISRRELMENY
jgi:integrase